MSEAHQTFVGVDGVARVYRQTFIPFDDSNDLLFDIMDAMRAAIDQIPKHYIDKMKGDDGIIEFKMSSIDPRDIINVIGTFASHIRQFGKPSEFFARIFVATERQIAPPADTMQSIAQKVARDAALAGSIMEAWKVAFWVVWHNYAPFLTEAMTHAGFSSTASTATPTSNQQPKKAEKPARPLRPDLVL